MGRLDDLPLDRVLKVDLVEQWDSSLNVHVCIQLQQLLSQHSSTYYALLIPCS